MPAPIPVSPLDWLPPIQQQLVLVTGLPIERVNFTIRDLPPMANIQDLLIRPGSFVSVGSVTFGAGRLWPMVTRELHVIVRTRLALDQIESDASFLNDPAFGHFQLEDLVYGALLDFQPTDATGNALLAVPLSLASGQQPRQPDFPTTPDLGQSVITFEATYALNKAAINDGVNL